MGILRPWARRLARRFGRSGAPSGRPARARGGADAECGVPEYWVVNLVGGWVEVFTAPAEGAYRSTARLTAGESIRLTAFPDVKIEVGEFLV